MSRTTALRIGHALLAHRFTHSDEAELQAGIAQALEGDGLAFQREVVIAPGDRIDFLVEGGVGIEVKVAGTAAAARRQLLRYAADDVITALVLVTSRSQVAALEWPEDAVPLYVVRTFGGLR